MTDTVKVFTPSGINILTVPSQDTLARTISPAIDTLDVLASETVLVEGVGQRGPKGDKGDPGTGSGAGNRYDHTQASAVATWTINHNLGAIPYAVAVLVGNHEWIADVEHTSVNQTVVVFGVPTSGLAVLCA